MNVIKLLKLPFYAREIIQMKIIPTTVTIMYFYNFINIIIVALEDKQKSFAFFRIWICSKKNT